MVDIDLNAVADQTLGNKAEGETETAPSLAAQLMSRHRGFGRTESPIGEVDPTSFRQIKLNPVAMIHAGEPKSFELSTEQAATLRSHIYQQAILNDLNDSDPLKADLMSFLENKPSTTLTTSQYVSLSKILSLRSSNPKDAAILNSIADLLAAD